MGESFLKTLGLKVVCVIKTLSTCKAPLVHHSTGFAMAPWKLLKKCQCSECVDVGGSDGHDWDSISYRGHHAHVCAGTPSMSFPSMSPNAVAAASDKLFISTFTNGLITTLPSSADTAIDTPTTWLSMSLHPNNTSLCLKTEFIMPFLAEILDDEDDEPPIPAQTSSHSEHRKPYGKIPL